jgi:hypothetical protein
MSTALDKQDASSQPAKFKEHRRSYRVLLRVPIVVMGETQQHTPFSEPTITLVVNAHGALIELATKVAQSQTLSIANLSSGEEVACRVVHSGTTKEGKAEIAVEFLAPSPLFWKIAFPPADWGTHK